MTTSAQNLHNQTNTVTTLRYKCLFLSKGLTTGNKNRKNNNYEKAKSKLYKNKPPEH